MSVAILAGLPFLGLLLGAFGTFIGTGGGFLFVPALLLLYPQEPPEAVATTSLVAVLVNSLSGAVAYGRLRRIDYRSGLVMAAGMVPGAILGAFTTRALDRELFQLIFGALFIALAAYIFFLPNRPRPAGRPAASNGARSLTDAAGRTFTYTVHQGYGMAVAFATGFAGGMLGIGGAALLVPSMVGFLGFPAQVATGTSQFTIILSTVAAIITHLSKVSLQEIWLKALLLSLGVVIGGQVGARLSFRSGSRLIVRVLAAAMVVVGAQLIVAAL